MWNHIPANKNRSRVDSTRGLGEAGRRRTLLHVNTLEMSLFRFGHYYEASRLQVPDSEILSGSSWEGGHPAS